MMNYRVSKIDDKNKILETKEFKNQNKAENYAENESLDNIEYSYEVQKKMILVQGYETIKIYKHGECGVKFEDVTRKK